MKDPSELPSQLIRSIILKNQGNYTVRDLFYTLGSQSFGLMFIVMGLFLTIPLPPGIGFIPASLLCIWSFQRALGGTQLWLPKIIAQKKVSPAITEKIETRALPLFEKVENWFFKFRYMKRLKETEIRLASLAVILLSLLIMLPTPFLNSIPAVIIVLMGLTIMSSNRRLLWVNMSFSILVIGFIGSTLYLGSEVILKEIGELMKTI